MAGDVYDLEGLAVPGEIDRLHELLEQAAAQHPHVPASDVMLFETAVIEIANNVVEHGRPEGEVAWHFRLVVEPTSLRAELSYSGQEYTGWVPGVDHEMPDALDESGRGLPLASAVLDELGYRREPDANVWTMSRRWAD